MEQPLALSSTNLPHTDMNPLNFRCTDHQRQILPNDTCYCLTLYDKYISSVTIQTHDHRLITTRSTGHSRPLTIL